MNRSLYTKLVLIMLLLILSLTAVVGAFLMNQISRFYLEDFYGQMKTVFETQEIMDDLRSAADNPDKLSSSEVASSMVYIIQARSGLLGINSRSRNYYILSGTTGSVYSGSGSETKLDITPNILTAMGGGAGYLSDRSAAYMDVAIPVSGSSGDYIVYIIDNKTTVTDLTYSLLQIIAAAMLVGLGISVILSLLLAKTIVTPIQQLTGAAEKVASGDFSQKPESDVNDEIGVLTRTFNEMAGQLERNLDDLKKSELLRKEFVANVSHELRTPITSIRSYAETLQGSGYISGEMRSEFLAVIVNESDRMTKIVQDLLSLSRFDAGSFEFQFERFSLEKSIRNVYNAMLLEAQKNGHNFTLELKSELPEIVGDRTRIEQVLINMVSNSIKYSKDGGVIRLTASHGKGAVKLSVKDNGIGIPEEDVPKVFDRFYRVDKARSRESGGTGLGLSIAKEIVTRHQGTIELKSKQGKGTTVTVTLPVEGPAHEE